VGVKMKMQRGGMNLERIMLKWINDSNRTCFQIMKNKFRDGKKQELELAMTSTMKSLAIKRLISIFYHMVKGAAGAFVVQWRMEMQEDLQAQKTKKLTEEFMKNGAVRQLRGIFARIVKGVVGEKVAIWQTNKSYGMHQTAEQLKEMLERQQGKAKNNAIFQLKASLARIMKGAAAEKVMIWRMEKDHEMAKKQIQMQEALAKGALQSAAIHQLSGILARILKGEKGYWLVLARQQWQWHKQQTAAMVARNLKMTDGLKKLAGILYRIVKGVKGEKVVIWRMEAKQAMAQNALAVQEALSKGRLKAAAVQMLTRTLAGRLKGEAYSWLVTARQTMQQAQADNAQALQGKLHQQMLHNVALQQLSAILKRITRGARAYRIELWKSKLRVNNLQHQEELRKSLAAGQQSAAVRMFAQIVMRRLKGLIGVCLMRWKQEYDLEKFDQYVEMRDKANKVKGLKELAFIMQRMVKGEKFARLRLWQSRAAANSKEGLREGILMAVGETDDLRRQMNIAEASMDALQASIRSSDIELDRMRKLLASKEDETVAALIAEKEAKMLLEKERALRQDLERQLQSARIGRIHADHEIGSSGIPGSPEALTRLTGPGAPESPSSRRSGTGLLQDQVRARAGQILIGFENVDPAQLGRISIEDFRRVLVSNGAIDELQVRQEISRLTQHGGTGANGMVDYVEWMCEHCEESQGATHSAQYEFGSRSPKSADYRKTATTPPGGIRRKDPPPEAPQQQPSGSRSRSSHINKLMANGARLAGSTPPRQ